MAGGINIFENLKDFGFVRNKTQALGFWLAYVILSIALLFVGSMITLAIYGLIGVNNYVVGDTILIIIFCLYPAVIAGLVIREKKLENSYYLATLLAIVLTYYTFTLGGLIPAALLTIWKKR